MNGSNGFQNLVNRQPGVAVAGDFADANVRANVLAGAGALIAAPLPRSPIVANFAWGDQVSGLAFSRFYGETTAKIGFVHRENQAVIIPFLADHQLYLEAGLNVTLFDQGSFWAHFAAAAAVGQKVFANYLDGSVYAAAAATTTTVASGMTGSLATTGVLTISALTGTLSVGSVLSGGAMPAGVAITSQLSGTAGGIGTYQTTGSTVVAALTSVVAANSVETNYFVDSPVVAPAVVTGTINALGVLNVTGVTSGVVEIGLKLSGAGIPTNTRIIGLISGSGGTGTYRTNLQVGPVVTSTTITASQGQLAKISTWG